MAQVYKQGDVEVSLLPVEYEMVCIFLDENPGYNFSDVFGSVEGMQQFSRWTREQNRPWIVAAKGESEPKWCRGCEVYVQDCEGRCPVCGRMLRSRISDDVAMCERFSYRVLNDDGGLSRYENNFYTDENVRVCDNPPVYTKLYLDGKPHGCGVMDRDSFNRVYADKFPAEGSSRYKIDDRWSVAYTEDPRKITHLNTRSRRKEKRRSRRRWHAQRFSNMQVRSVGIPRS